MNSHRLRLLQTWFKKKPLLNDNWLGLLIILFSWITFFSRTLIGRSIYFLDDLKIIYYPLEITYATFQQMGQLPQWSPLFGFGQPLLAWAQLGFFAPLHWLLRAFLINPLTILQISILTYFGLGLLGMYAFLRSLKLPSLACAAGALVFVFSGFNIGHLNHVNFYTATMLLPWLLFSISRFLDHPRLTRLTLMSLFAATIILSAQPQVILYTFTIAAIVGLCLFGFRLYSTYRASRARPTIKYLTRTVLYSILAAILALGLGSFNLLPLMEFLPLTERADGLDELVLYEFSYPPQHAVTLIFPFFFGDHENYWGAKGFQELAAFVGIIPILLAGVALFTWRRHKPLILASLILLIISVALALGKHSPIYSYLVTEKILTSLSVPGRFVYFFIVAMSLLSALGVSHLISSPAKKSPTEYVLIALVFPILLFTPFVLAFQNNSRLFETLLNYLSWGNPTSWLFILGLVAFFVTAYINSGLWRPYTIPTLVSLIAFTLIYFGWSYNPLTPSAQAYNHLEWTSSILSDSSSFPYPRLYSRPQLLRDKPLLSNVRKTESISSQLSIYQPVQIIHHNFACISLPLHLQPDRQNHLTLSVFDSLDAPPLRQMVIQSSTLNNSEPRFCFDPIPTNPGQQFIVGLTSPDYTGLRPYLYPTEDEHLQSYIVRKSPHQVSDIESSRKPLTMVIYPEPATTLDSDLAIGSRHLNVLANSSSARWIGALSIREYRQFIETFFANDQEPFDGDGFHVIERNRRLFNLAGITHFMQLRPLQFTDRAMAEQGFSPASEQVIGHSSAALYTNPQAFPKAFLTPQGVFEPAADEARALLLDPEFDVSQTAIISGPTPPNHLPLPPNPPLEGRAVITNYQPTRVDIDVTTNRQAFLILSDTTTPQWHTLIDGESAPQYTAYTVFKAALIPPGRHQVTFYYHSPAVSHAQKLATASLIVILLLLLLATFNALPQKSNLTQSLKNFQSRLHRRSTVN